MPIKPGGQRRLIFVNNVNTNLFNKYTPGSGIGAYNTSVRRALKIRASSNAGSLDKNGNYIPSIKKACCSAELK